MGTPHLHREIIKAWADGAEIQKFCGDGWYDDSDTPEWFEDVEYRIKPRTVKREGWVNIYRAPGWDIPSAATVHITERLAKTYAVSGGLVATVKVAWEEDE